MKKILFVIGSFGNGGVTKTLLNAVSDIEAQNFDITILPLFNSNYENFKLPNRVRVLNSTIPPIINVQLQGGRRSAIKLMIKSLDIKSTLQWLYYNFLLIISREKSVKYIASFVGKIDSNYDVIVDYLGYGSYITEFVSSTYFKAKKISFVHTEFSASGINMRGLEKKLGYFDWIYGVSKRCCEDLSEKYPNLSPIIKVCYNIIPTDEIVSLSSQQIEIVFDTDKINIVTVGRLAPEKGIDLAINIAKRLVDEEYNFNWYICGNGREYDKYQQMISDLKLNDNFFLLGYRSNPYPCIKQCDIYVQPSRYEGYCMTVAEAIILQKNIVATNVAGVTEQLEGYSRGIVVDIEENSIFNGIIKMMNGQKKEVIDNNVSVKPNIWTYLQEI